MGAGSGPGPGVGPAGGAGGPAAVPPGPRSAMVFPLVVLVAVLPGLVALKAWDLTPPGPLWGLRGLAVVDGLVLDQVPAADAIKPVQEAAAYRTVAFQPPLYAWLEAALFWLDGDRDPMASVLPSYVAGGLAVMLVYLHGRLWRGAGLGLTAAILVGLQPEPAAADAGGDPRARWRSAACWRCSWPTAGTSGSSARRCGPRRGPARPPRRSSAAWRWDWRCCRWAAWP